LTSILSTYPNLFEPHLENLYKYLLSLCLPPPDKSSHLPLLLQPSTYTSISPAQAGGEASSEAEADEERYSAALEFLLTLMETADYIPLRALLNEDKGAMVKMLLGRMYVALGSQGDEEDDLAEWLKADDVSGMQAMKGDGSRIREFVRLIV
jgi:hypothetical protein